MPKHNLLNEPSDQVMDGLTIFVDLDGVLVDFISDALECNAATDLLNDWPPGKWSVSKILGITEAEFWSPINGRGHEFWANLRPYPWKDELVQLISSLDPAWTVATAPSRDPSCPYGKTIWMQAHLPASGGAPFRRFSIGGRKHFLARSGRILIDDNDSNVEKFNRAGGVGILFPQPWNALHSIADSMAYVADQLALAAKTIRAETAL